MAFAAKILKDSLSNRGHRLTTFEVTLPRIILSEFNTHRVLSRNSASSRAIPVEKRIASVEADPFVPEAFGKNKGGMQASEDLDVTESERAKEVWMEACRDAVASARKLANLGVHKQLANRVIEPFCWHTIICSGTEWENYFALRCHPDAQPEIKKVSEMMERVYEASTPTILRSDQWHLPLVDDFDELISAGFMIDDIKRISIGRCARVSYLTHDGKRDPVADVTLCNRLKESGHMSPFEHVARPMGYSDFEAVGPSGFAGNFRGWVQARKEIPYEDNYKLAKRFAEELNTRNP